jgi:hypothetical protein
MGLTDMPPLVTRFDRDVWLNGLIERLGINADTAAFARRGPLHERQVIPLSASRKPAVSEQRYTIDRPLAEVFHAYRTADSSSIWPRERIQYRCAYLPGSTEPLLAHESFGGLQVGMKFFGDLLVHPFPERLRLMVGVEVTKIAAERELRYDYLDGSVTAGWNSVFFAADGAGATRIHHYSEYIGTSFLHRALMPIFQPILHVGFVDALHGGMKRRIEAAHVQVMNSRA